MEVAMMEIEGLTEGPIGKIRATRGQIKLIGVTRGGLMIGIKAMTKKVAAGEVPIGITMEVEDTSNLMLLITTNTSELKRLNMKIPG